VIKHLALLLAAGLLLAACGSVSASSAMISWATQSNFATNAKSLYVDTQHSARALRTPSISKADLHTVCGVLLLEAQAANSSLPTPDAQATKLLSGSYADLGAGANQCYRAESNLATRATAIASLAKGAALLAEATARVATTSLP
jgi:hypothetical protein